MIRVPEQTILLISEDDSVRAAARRRFEDKDEGLRVTTVSTVDAARRVVEETTPAVILLEEGSVAPGSDGAVRKMPRLNSVVAALAIYAPVVVMARADQETELATLVAAGAADFVERAEKGLPLALELVERRLRQSQEISGTARELVPAENAPPGEAFGEVLRHELNNPLTGILGNAELLLAEVRRKNDGKLPLGGQQRLETIAALAVRLRETVRRLSQEWESSHPGELRAALKTQN
jgi:signal transduction histidine kinase